MLQIVDRTCSNVIATFDNNEFQPREGDIIIMECRKHNNTFRVEQVVHAIIDKEAQYEVVTNVLVCPLKGTG